MFDMHYDLLTHLYICYMKNDFSEIEELMKKYNDNNVRGLIANLCFMSIDEMKEEYHEKYYQENISVVDMFTKCMELLRKYIPYNTKVLTSIEGCDFLEIEDLEKLKKLGLNAILPVWNNKNKYGSGSRSEIGLTKDGEKLIEKCIELNIGIDLSHANENTFFDIIDIVKEYRNKGIYPVVYASHSNTKFINDVPRNLTDEQILALISVDGKIGILEHCNFTLKDSIHEKVKLIGKDQYYEFMNNLKKTYMLHILHVARIASGVDNIVLSSDDMNFSSGNDYKYSNIFEYSKLYKENKELLSKVFDHESIIKIMYANAYEIYNKLKNENVKKLNFHI